jgi:CubicO group peptidase (beta-lactamase class C family)
MKFTIIFIVLLATQQITGQVQQILVTKNSAIELNYKNIETEIDAIFNQAYPANSPGAAVLIAKDDKIIYRKAFGLANIELNVQMKPENIFHLASITKQFTSVAILILMEQGKLTLQDALSQYIADFPRGNEITLHHLLNHTSGIKSYTNLPDFRSKTRLDMTPEEIISSFKNLPLDFNPNEKYEYSNSGYLLLGYIIEKISNMSYEDFIQKNIFDKLGMKNSYYANSYKIISNRANGYQLYESNFENPEYMSPSIAYSAGSLMSTVDDLFLWNTAIQNNILISEKSKQLAFTNYKLNNGKQNNYGYGWAINKIEGNTTIEHPGGINGFSNSGIYLLDKKIYAIVLTNLDDGKGPEMYNLKAISALLGKPITEYVTIKLSETQLKKWIGSYQFDDVIRFITYENDALYSMREGGRPLKLIPLSEDEYRFENSFATYKFSSRNGKKQIEYKDRIKKSIGIEKK